MNLKHLNIEAAEARAKMTPDDLSKSEAAAQTLADAYLALEEEARKFNKALKDFVVVAPGMGPITQMTFINEGRGILGAIGRHHLAIAPFDPRPKPFDGSGK